MASGSPARIQARDRVSNDHAIRIHEDLTHHESEDVLPFAHGGAGRNLAQSREKALEVLGQLQVGILTGQPDRTFKLRI